MTSQAATGGSVICAASATAPGGAVYRGPGLLAVAGDPASQGGEGNTMKHTYPDLLVRINDAEGEEAEALYDQWDANERAARAYYAGIKGRLPPKLVEFAEMLCLHDADWMGLNVLPSRDGNRLDVAAINVRQQDNVITLVYDLLEEPQWSGPEPASRIWSNEQVIWLYDEIGLLNDTTFTHEILLSNGKVLRLVFFQFNFSVSGSLSNIPRSAVSA